MDRDDRKRGGRGGGGGGMGASGGGGGGGGGHRHMNNNTGGGGNRNDRDRDRSDRDRDRGDRDREREYRDRPDRGDRDYRDRDRDRGDRYMDRDRDRDRDRPERAERENRNDRGPDRDRDRDRPDRAADRDRDRVERNDRVDRGGDRDRERDRERPDRVDRGDRPDRGDRDRDRGNRPSLSQERERSVSSNSSPHLASSAASPVSIPVPASLASPPVRTPPSNIPAPRHGIQFPSSLPPQLIQAAAIASPPQQQPTPPQAPQQSQPLEPTSPPLQPLPQQKPFAQDPSLIFPSTPYTPAVDLFMNPHLRAQFYAPPSKLLINVTVGGSKFSHLINIQAFEEKPKPSIILPNVLCQTYRAVNRFNHKASILRRLVECNAQPADCAAVYERFRHFRHPNLIPLLNITQSNEFVLGSNDIIFEYRQVKGAKSFVEHFFTPQDSMPVNVVEGVLWSIGCQLLCLLRAFHEVKTPLRGIHFSKLLWLESAERVLFSGVGLVDIVGPAPQSSFSDCAKGDVISVGVLLLQLASRNPLATERDLHELQNKFYTPGFVKLVRTMIEGNIPVPQLCAALGERMAMEVGHQEGHADYFYGECAKEAHNGRLMKLLMKLNFVIGSFQDTADWGNDANERFAIRMFHSYLFNQVDENNRVRLDWGHVYSCLNKLDCGSDELVHLISTDSNSTIMVVAYRDLRNLLEQIFETLKSQVDALAATPPTMTGY